MRAAMSVRFCRFASVSGEIDNDLDVVRLAFERVGPAFERFAPRDQPVEPSLVGALQGFACHLVVPAIGIHRAEYRVVVEHHGAVELPDIDIEVMAGRGDTDEADDT